MSDYLTEQEQIELLKSWIKQYAPYILAGFAVAMLAVFGWRYWQDRQVRIMTHASNVYNEMIVARAQNDIEKSNVQAEKLRKHYSSTVYAQMADLILARNAAIKSDWSGAKNYLQHAIDHSHDKVFKQIAELRLAKIALVEKAPQRALEILEKIDDDAFSSLINETRGDAYIALNNKPKARAAYQTALNALNKNNAETTRPLLQMKYDNLATSSTS